VAELQTLSKAIAMIRLLQGRPAVGVTHLARELEISASAAHRIVSTLRAEGVLEQEPRTRRYVLAAGVSLTPTHTELERCIAIASEVLPTLRDATNETVHVGVLSGTRAIMASGVESHAQLRVSVRTGMTVPAHTAATGKVLLAALSDQEIHDLLHGRHLETPTEYSITSFAGLMDEIHSVRQRGFARNVSETEDGIYSVATPICGASGDTIAALAVSAPLARLGKRTDGANAFAREGDFLREARLCASAIHARLLSNAGSTTARA
jgi:IclR family acetate operon transcriptional repressor